VPWSRSPQPACSGGVTVGEGAVGDGKEYGRNNHLLRSLAPCCCFLVGVGYERKLAHMAADRKRKARGCEGVKQTLSSSASCYSAAPLSPPGHHECPSRLHGVCACSMAGHRLCCPIAPLPLMLSGRSMLMPHMTPSTAPGTRHPVQADAKPRVMRCTAGKTTPAGT
jgi:hypothetical protein